MAGKTLAVVGAGPGIGMAVARRFGREGYRVALIARNRVKLDGHVEELAASNIEAAGFTADVTDERLLRDALEAARTRFGAIDVMEYSPMVSYDIVRPVLEIDTETARKTLDLYLLGPLTVVNAVLGPMLEKGEGALLFTSGASAVATYPSHGSVSVAMGALRQYVRMLHASLAHRGVYAGSIIVAQPPEPDLLADLYWAMVQDRDRPEHVFGTLEIGEAYELLAARGFGPGFPPGLTAPLPEPRDDAERRTFLLGLYQAKINAMWHGDPQAAEGRADHEAARLGGKLGEIFYGVQVAEV